MHEDRRQIQTAVLGTADSEIPLLLPLEAIELNAFRQQHQHDTFWCGILLGGCGTQLATKLYTDRVCHFAHHPGHDGQPHHCGRQARGVGSADHLYVKAAATAWLRDRDEHADIDFVRPGGAAYGSVVDIRFKDTGLRVHLDQEVEPDWDEDGQEPVLGVSVPVDRDTLIRRWYVHRIRLESEGTSRRVRIGTEAFARPTEWFPLDDCAMTQRGLSTPAVEEIVRSRTSRPVSTWTAGRTRKVPAPQARAEMLLEKLADARRLGSVLVVTRVCHEISALTGVEGPLQGRLQAAVATAERWLGEQAAARRALFAGLQQAVVAGDNITAGRLLSRANAIAGHARTEAEQAIAASAAECLEVYARHRQAKMAAKRADRDAKRVRQAADKVQALLAALERGGVGQPRKPMRRMVKELELAATSIGVQLDAQQRNQIDIWRRRAEAPRPREPRPRTPAAPGERGARPQRKPPLHEQVARRLWLKKPCPRCRAAKGAACLNDERVGGGSLRQIPHDERFQLLITERQNQAKLPAQRPAASPLRGRPQRVVDVACPTCKARPGSGCRTPDGRPHNARVARLRRGGPTG
ncbi:zinc finger domain-containing protein [Streptomyces sp. NBC_01465]|uniref:zinc finger domain-containing protein n=1 Tax=Streptomyces sp. NBC_01465 TaxID=2903878 RepID=UPI002E327818|nr:hypothetical protein [Streptomyces sp. NBC_01465]